MALWVSSLPSTSLVLLLLQCSLAQFVDEGRSCPSEKQECFTLRYCDDYAEDIKEGVHPPLCGFMDNEPFVCCPKVPFDGHERISVTMCRNFEVEFKKVFKPAAFGGEPAAPKEFAFMALIGYGSEGDNDWRCGGSLISPNYILSAAHCTRTEDKGLAKWALLGELNKATSSEDAKPEIFKIVSHYNHPAYKPPALYNDIALYRLNKVVHFNDYIKPICLYTGDHSTSAYKTAIAAGWGRLGPVEKLSSQLMKVELDILKKERCTNSGSKDQIPLGFNSKSMICAGTDDGSRDTCSGDSGGPLFLPKDNFYSLHSQLGITSFGKLCGQAEYPGVYTRVSNYLTWIEKIVWPLNSTDALTLWHN